MKTLLDRSRRKLPCTSQTQARRTIEFAGKLSFLASSYKKITRAAWVMLASDWSQSSIWMSCGTGLLRVVGALSLVLKKRFAADFPYPNDRPMGLRSSTVKFCDVPCTGEVVSLSPRKRETVWPSLECIVAESFDNVCVKPELFKVK